jgi:hypothetical protein
MQDPTYKDSNGNEIYNKNEKRVIETINYMNTYLDEFELLYIIFNGDRYVNFRRINGNVIRLKDVKNLAHDFEILYDLLNSACPLPMIDCFCYAKTERILCFESNEWKKLPPNYKFYSGKFNFNVTNNYGINNIQFVLF